MMRHDLDAARKKWIEEAQTKAERKQREKSPFLRYVDDDGRFADFHALRKTFITNLSLAGVRPKAAQTLARHSDINLTMNTYTTLEVHDQAAAVESLPAVPSSVERQPNPPQQLKIAPVTEPVAPPSLPPEVAQILAAWEQRPPEVRASLAAKAQSTTAQRSA